jgi:hypothetical protein
MAADAVIIDDGGSTRIKQLKGDEADGKMDDLISEKTDQAKGTFSKLRVVFFDAAGGPHGPFDRTLGADDRIEIQSGNLQKVICLLNGAKKLSLSLESADADLESLVDAKQSKQQRRYIVSNAGRILKVQVNSDPAVFDFESIAEHKTSVYTMVILT